MRTRINLKQHCIYRARLLYRVQIHDGILIANVKHALFSTFWWNFGQKGFFRRTSVFTYSRLKGLRDTVVSKSYQPEPNSTCLITQKHTYILGRANVMVIAGPGNKLSQGMKTTIYKYLIGELQWILFHILSRRTSVVLRRTCTTEYTHLCLLCRWQFLLLLREFFYS